MKFAHKLTLALLVVLAVVLSLCNTVLIGQQFRQELHTAQETLSADWQRESRAMQRTLVTPTSGSLAARVGSYLQAITEQNSLACAAYSVDGTSLYYALPTAVPLSEVEALLAQIVSMGDACESAPSLTGAPDTVTRIIWYLNQHLKENITLDQLSERFFISKHHLNKVFRKATGTTVFDYLLHKRITAAQQLLITGYSAQEAASQAGFGDYSSFYRAYTRINGHSPLRDRGVLPSLDTGRDAGLMDVWLKE